MPTYEPPDLDDMTLLEACDAVLADLLGHPVTPDSLGLSTVLRHIDLLCHLTALVTGETQYCVFFDHGDDTYAAQAEPFSQAAGHLGRATAHYAQALAPVLVLCTSGAQSTPRQPLDTLDLHSRLRVHLAGAVSALSEARRYLTPQRPADGHTVPTPPPPAHKPPRLR